VVTTFLEGLRNLGFTAPMMNKRPTNASKNQCVSTLIHSYIFRRLRGAIFKEFNMSLLNVQFVASAVPSETKTTLHLLGEGRSINRTSIL
jgi:hypothetical protein